MGGKTVSTADIIEARCTKCRSVLNHTIVAMVGTRVVRVQCNTCGGQHNYRPPVEEKSPAEKTASRKTTSPRVRKEPVPAGPTEWERAMEGVDTDKAIPYDMNGAFRVNDLTSHSTFGIGIVTTVMKPNKMEVLFRDGKKLLRCAL